MIKKIVWLSIVFAVLLTVFLVSFFGVIKLNLFVTGFGLFAGMLFWSVSNGPITIRSRHRRWILLLILGIALILWLVQNRFMALSFVILLWGIMYAFWELDHYKNRVVRFSLRNYCLFWGFSLVYFMGFAVAANVIGSNRTLRINCDDIYAYYTKVSDRVRPGKKSPERNFTQETLSWGDRVSRELKILLNDTPRLQEIYNIINLYKQDITATIIDQKEINQEICALVTDRIHAAYGSSQIQRWLIVIIWLFLYPFFILLFYLYGIIAYILFQWALYYWIFQITRRTVEKTGLGL